MSNFFKSIVVVLLSAILITTFAVQKEEGARREEAANQEVAKLENDIDNGLIVNDGIILKDDQVQFKKSGNNVINKTTSSIGRGITSLVSKILKFIANLIVKLLS